MASVGITPEERARLRGLLKIATETMPAIPSKPVVDETSRQEALLAFYFWFKKWSTIAKRTTTRNDYLLRLTLKTLRKTPSGDEVIDDIDEDNDASD